MGHTIEFRASGVIVEWDDRFENILELAEEHDIDIDYECRQGYCGTCKVKKLTGEVDMETDDGLEEEDIERGFILPCVAVPLSDVVLDA